MCNLVLLAGAIHVTGAMGMEILGGYGYTMDYDMQRHFRDYKQMVFAPITDEMAINVLARMIGLPKSYCAPAEDRSWHFSAT